MIIDTPYIIELARGVDRRIMQDGDVQLIVPPVLQVGVELCLPHQLGLGTGVLAETSATANFNQSKTNGGATNQEILRLSPGLYTIALDLSLRANYTTLPNATPDYFVRLILPSLVNAVNLVAAFATVGSNVNFFRTYKFMLKEEHIVQVVVQPNGVGQTLDSALAVVASRHL